MTRFLFVGDVHASDSAPSKRDANYREDILNKLREIVDISSKTNCDAVIFAGDIFHHKEPRKNSFRLVLDLMAIFEAFSLPVYICVGNHDITEGRLESLEKQPLGVLSKLDNVTILPSKFDSSNEDSAPALDIGDVVLHSVPGIKGITVDDYHDFPVVDDKWNICVVHQSIVPDKSKLHAQLQDKDFMHDSQEVANIINCDVILYGHEHSNHGVYKRTDASGKEKLFVNLGSICRGTISDSDLKKEPSVFVLQLEEKVSGKVIKLKNVRPIEDCYLLEEHFAQVSRNEDISRAVHSFKDTRLERFSIESVIGDVEIRDDIDNDVREATLSLLETVR